MEYFSLDNWSWMTEFKPGASRTWNKNAYHTSNTGHVPGLLWANIIFLRYDLFHQSFLCSWIKQNINFLCCSVVIWLFYPVLWAPCATFSLATACTTHRTWPLTASVSSLMPFGNYHFVFMFWITVTYSPPVWVTVDCYECYCPIPLIYTHPACFVM